MENRELNLKLIGKIKNLIAKQHLEKKSGWKNFHCFTRRGGLVYNSESEFHDVCIDGRIFTWEELGRMLTGYEGFNFRLEMIDPPMMNWN